MSSHGEDFSDEERNNMEHGGASQAESDVEDGGPNEGDRVINLRENIASGMGGGDGEDNGVDGVAGFNADDGDWGASDLGAAKSKAVDTNAASGSTNNSEFSGEQDDHERSGSGWDAPMDHTGINTEGEQTMLSGDDWGPALPAENLATGNLTVKEFCKRLKLFRSPDVTVLVGHEEQPFTVPKDLLSHNSKFFDRALKGNFKESVEQTIRLPEDTVTAFQMMLQWIYTGNVKLYNDSVSYGHSKITDAYLEFFKLADKTDLLGPLNPLFRDFRDHLRGSVQMQPHSDCNETCAQHINRPGSWPGICTCTYDAWNSPSRIELQGGPEGIHDEDCGVIYTNCPSKQAHIDPLRSGNITSQHIRAAFELNHNHEASTILAQACVTSYLVSDAMAFKFRFADELETVDGFSQALLREVARIVVKDSKTINPLNGKAVGEWPAGFPVTKADGGGAHQDIDAESGGVPRRQY